MFDGELWFFSINIEKPLTEDPNSNDFITHVVYMQILLELDATTFSIRGPSQVIRVLGCVW